MPDEKQAEPLTEEHHREVFSPDEDWCPACKVHVFAGEPLPCGAPKMQSPAEKIRTLQASVAELETELVETQESLFVLAASDTKEKAENKRLCQHVKDVYTINEVLLDQNKRLQEALEATKEYFDQRADIQTDNPHAPNEEMRLWEEINLALATTAPKPTRDTTLEGIVQDAAASNKEE